MSTTNTRKTSKKEVTPKDVHDDAKASTVELQRDPSSVPNETTRIQISVMHNIRDRWEGMSVTEMVWGSEPNSNFVTEALASGDVREEVARFFVSRGIVNVLGSMIPTVMLKPAETAYTKAQFAAAIASTGMSSESVAVTVELCLPTFIKMGLVSDNIKYSRQMRYGFNRVTVSNIRHDVAMFQVIQAVKAVNVAGVNPTEKVSVTVFAESVAEAMRSIGLALYEIIDLSQVVDDIVRGVRAHLDPTLSVGELVGTVPADWRNNRVVSELAQNLVFARAALSLPPGYVIAPASDSWKLEKWAPVVLAAIKSSARYAWIGRAEYLRHHSLRKVRNIKGRVVTAVLSRRVEVQPVAQAVLAIEDVSLPGSYNITATKDRIAEVVQAAYGSATFSTEIGADLIASSLTDGIQMGWLGNSAGYVVDAEGSGGHMGDVAVMLADRLYVPVESNEDGTSVVLSSSSAALAASKSGLSEELWEPMWWYAVRTKEASMDVWSGQHLGSEIVTSDPVEVLMAVEEFEAKDALAARPQMLSSAAFNTRVVDFDDRTIQKVDTRYSFRVNIMSVEVSGNFRAIDFSSLRSGVHTSLVLPHFNEGVVHGLQSAFSAAQELLEKMASSDESQWAHDMRPNAAFFEHVRHRLARELLKIAQKLSPAFRKEVHMTMIERALSHSQTTGSEANILRAQLTQKTFAAYADVIALHFFLFLQGIEMSSWKSIIESDEMIGVCMEMGSDR